MATTPLVTKSLEERVYEAVRDAIVTGELPPGAPLVEAQLSEQYGISKTPVREALIRLKRDGLVASAPHRMNRVAMPAESDIREACEARMWIEVELAVRAARDPSQRLLKGLRQSITRADEALQSDDQPEYVAAIRSFSVLLAQHSGNSYALEFLERLRDRLAIAVVSRRAPGRRKRSIEEHRAILDAIERGDPASAAEATRRHLRSIESDAVAALRELDERAA
jgi:GntR family transcriptional regulator, rspAB operon transcriptional repressor